MISKEVKIDGFRPGKVPYEVLKKKIGEMSILIFGFVPDMFISDHSIHLRPSL